MDQIFDRFERLFKSWLANDLGDLGPRPSARRGFGDPDLDAAMSELDDYLDRGRTETEARERQEAADEARREREDAARQRGGYGSTASGPPSEIVRAYRTMGLPFGTPFPQVKIQYKKLLMQNHPDRNSATPEQLRRSTEISAQINEAYQRIETWTTTGKVAD